jgi:FK506-binding protein 14
MEGALALVALALVVALAEEVLQTESEGPKVVNVFKKIDTDSNEALTREEFGSYLQEQVEARKARGKRNKKAEKMMEDQDKLVDKIFAHEDKDKDGVISLEEFSGPKHDEL